MVTKHEGVEVVEDDDSLWAQWEDSVMDFADTEPMGLPEIKEEFLPAPPDDDDSIDFWANTDIAPLT
jgi:hypothetical protein